MLAVIAKALSTDHEVTILTLDNPAQEDRTMYGLHDSDIRFEYLRFPALRLWEYLPCKAYSYLYKKVLPHTKLTSRWYGNSSFPHSCQKILLDQLNKGDYDVVVGVHAFLSLRLATVRERIRAPRVIGWMHNSYQAFFENQPSYLGGLSSHFAHQMRRLDDVVVLTHVDADLYEQRLNLHPIVIYNPLTIEPQGHARPEAKRFVAIGRFSARHKGFDILIEGFARFARQNSDWTLDIVGEGPEEAMLRGLIAKHQLEGRISIHPFTKEVQKHYAAASVYVLSSRWEGFGLVLLEAMAHGLPLIASSIPPVMELLGGKDNVLIFANEDIDSLACQMAQMAAMPVDELARMGEVSEQLCQSFALPAIREQWENLLKLTR